MTVTAEPKNTVNHPLTPESASRPIVENDAYAAFARRIVRSYARRVAAGDVEALPGLLDLADELDHQTHLAVMGLRAFGYSWGEIAARIGVTRQAAQKRWGGEKS